MKFRYPLLGAATALLSLLVGTSPAAAVGVSHPQVVSANPADTTPHVLDGTVQAIATVGSRVYVGGNFTQVAEAGTSSPTLSRRSLFAYDRTTGDVLDFAPALDGAVETIAATAGGNVIIGGRFKTVNATAQRSLAMLTPGGLRVSTFKARTNGYVLKALVRGDRLLAGGKFTTANGVARAHLAAFSATTGALETGFNLPLTEGRVKSSGTASLPSLEEMDANAEGTRLVVLGNFRKVGDLLRQQIAMIDLTTNSVTDWYTDRCPNDRAGTQQQFQCYQVFETQMRDVEFSPNGSYFVVVTTGGAPDFNTSSLCDTTVRWETNAAPNARETWKNCTGGDTLYSVAVTGSAVYVGGHQRWLDNCGGRGSAVGGSFSADGIGAIDPVTGLAIRSWNPGRTRGVGAEELVATAEGLHIGSDTIRLGGEYHARLGFFPL